jgi:large subunit ribosomal protein L29
MKGIKVQDIRANDVPSLEKMLDEEREALYRARRDLVFRRITDHAQLKVRRKNIARILTLIQEKKMGGEA